MSIVQKLFTAYRSQIQKTKAPPYLLLVLMVLIIYLPANPGIAADPAPLKEITVVSDDNYPPYIFRDDKGLLQGILVDEWHLWEERTGIKVDLRGMDWDKAQKTMAEGNAQVIDTIFFTEKRAKTLAFSAPYASLDVPIFFHSDISGIRDVKSLHGFTIGVKAGDACIDFLKRHGIHTLLEFPSYESIVRAAAEQKIRVFCIDAPPAHYYLYKMNLEQQYRQTTPLYTGQFHRAVHKERMDLLLAVEEGFAKISRKEHEEIEKRWRGSTIALPHYLIYLFYPMGGLVILGAILLLWNHTLRRKVTQKTVQLQDAIYGLEKSEKKYRTLFENASEAIFVVQDGNLVFLNPMSVIMTDYSAEELMSRPFIEFIHADDRDMVIDKHLKRLKGEEIPHSYSFRIIHRDGNIRWVELNAVLINWNGNPATLNFLGDITDRRAGEEALKESENKYRVIAENMTDVITIVDMNLRFTYVSPSIMRMRGYTAEEAMEQPLEQVMTPESLQISAKVFEEEMQREASGTADPDRVRIIELEEYRKDMSTVWVEVSLSFLRDVDGRPIGMLSLTRDITERKKAEEDLKETLESLRKALGTTIQVMVSAVEMRDPYTAGHQIRSTDLARAIATEMGLSQDKIEAIRMAGPIHDIGKLSVPAEILSKPTKLTEH